MGVDGEASGEADDRLARAAEASDVVIGLDALKAGEVASTVSDWLRSAYEMIPVCRERDCHGLAFAVLGLGAERLLLSCVRGGFEATPEDPWGKHSHGVGGPRRLRRTDGRRGLG